MYTILIAQFTNYWTSDCTTSGFKELSGMPDVISGNFDEGKL